ncbi:MAG TPA: tyrosine--tRNA ligase [Gammaproteobacteria bacterium]|nr:tyrosine--tRNA ligase [Gammaproteobacteria bacterium]
MTQELEELKRGVVECIGEDLLESQIASGQKLTIKAGFDPTSPDIHFGHTVLLHKLRQFQQYGHHVVFLIGDFTAMIGDPSGRNATRPTLTLEDVRRNAKTYEQQIYKILDPKKTKVAFNSKWLSSMGLKEVIELTSQYTVARMLERDDFEKRYNQQKPISLHEFLYPILQGYDSVALKADVELGGQDQKFNLLMGREYQKYYKQKPQVVMMMPLLEGLDGVKKMSKSYHNAIGIDENPNDMFGKIMSIPDAIMWNYYDLLSSKSLGEIRQLKSLVKQGENPRNIKIMLAKEMVELFHGVEKGQEAQEFFETKFTRKAVPDVLPEIILTEELLRLPWPQRIKQAGLAKSSSEALRLIKQGAVKLNQEKISLESDQIPKIGDVLSVGKKIMIRWGG